MRQTKSIEFTKIDKLLPKSFLNWLILNFSAQTYQNKVRNKKIEYIRKYNEIKIKNCTVFQRKTTDITFVSTNLVKIQEIALNFCNALVFLTINHFQTTFRKWQK